MIRKLPIAQQTAAILDAEFAADMAYLDKVCAEQLRQLAAMQIVKDGAIRLQPECKEITREMTNIRIEHPHDFSSGERYEFPIIGGSE